MDAHHWLAIFVVRRSGTPRRPRGEIGGDRKADASASPRRNGGPPRVRRHHSGRSAAKILRFRCPATSLLSAPVEASGAVGPSNHCCSCSSAGVGNPDGEWVVRRCDRNESGSSGTGRTAIVLLGDTGGLWDPARYRRRVIQSGHGTGSSGARSTRPRDPWRAPRTARSGPGPRVRRKSSTPRSQQPSAVRGLGDLDHGLLLQAQDLGRPTGQANHRG